MKNIFLTLVVLTFLSPAMAQTTAVGDATLANKKTYNDQELVLNGAGLREKLWFDLYAAGLFLKDKNSKASTIISEDKPMAIKLVVLSSLLSKKKMIGALREGFESTNDKQTLTKIQPEIDRFIAFVSDEISINDSYDIYYMPGKGSHFYKNDKLLGVIEGLTFKKALFNIWLSKSPVDDDLKANMLGI